MVGRKSRYQKLCAAYDNGVAECNQYRQECYDFVNDLRSAVIENMDIPETKIFLYSPEKGFVLKKHRFSGGAFETEFADGGVSLIGFAINANDDKAEDKFFTFIVSFKRVKDGMFFSLIDDDCEFPNSPEGFADFCEYLFETANGALRSRLKFFLQNPEEEEGAPIGFKVNREV